MNRFVPPVVEEEEGSEDPAVIQTYFTSESKVAYSIVQAMREPNAES
jgi:hypothetical protein